MAMARVSLGRKRGTPHPITRLYPIEQRRFALACRWRVQAMSWASFGKGHERSMCYGETEYPWNEQEAMLSALRSSKAGAGIG